MTADDLKEAVGRYYGQKCFAVATEIGLNSGGSLRADLMAVNMRGQIIVVETKSSYADFRSDKKWWHYIDYCHKLYFSVSEELYAKVFDLIPKGIGILTVDECKNVHARQGATTTHLDSAVQQELLIRMLFRHSEFNRYKRH